MVSALKFDSGDSVRIVRACSAFNCGGRCPLRLHVKNGIIVRVEGDDSDDNDKQLRACLRCRADRKHVHHPDRLTYPRKRTGAKGSGKFERISWDQAYDEIAERLVHVKQTYGKKTAILGGIDVDFLCRASQEEIRKRVRDTLDVCHPGGGYCLGSGNSVANYIPLDNYLAMLDEGRLF